MKKITKETYLNWYKDMLFWRKFEDKLAAVYIQQKVRGFLHLYNGQEAVLAGSLHAMDLTKDKMITAYRNHVQPIGMGVDPKRVMAELYGKVTGTSKGMGGSMHIFSKEHRFYGGHGIVGGQIPLGAGIAFGDKYHDKDAVTLTYFGDGAARQGSLHETFNMAMLWKLPVVFVVENNGYAMGTSVERTANHEDIWKLGLGYEMPSRPVDGMNPVKVAEAMYEAIEHARKGNGPTFLEMKTYRYRGHSMSDAQHYRTKDEVAEYKKIDPITQVLDIIKEKKYATDAEIEATNKEVKALVSECEKFAEESPFPETQQLYDMVYEQTDYPFIKHKEIMAEIINMPRLSDTMEEGVVAKWLKNVGDTIEEGDILAEIETDKAVMEFESFHEGVLLHVGIHEGESAKVDSLLAIIGEKGEDVSELLNSASAEAVAVEAKEETEPIEEKSTTKNSDAPDLPEGVEIITMPRLSDTMTEGTVATWLKKVGDDVSEGDILAEIETDKATMEFESFYEGNLLYIGINEGESAMVDSVLAVIGKKGTDVSGVIEDIKKGAFSKAQVVEEKTTAPKVAPKKEESTPIIAPPAVTKNNDGGRIFASPLAKKIAQEKGINLAQVNGTGENGRIIKSDIENFTPSATGSTSAPFVPSGQESFEETPNSQMRKVIARRLGESKFTAPHYYLNVEFNMDNAIAFRQQFNSIPDTKISFNDIIVKATALALKQHPQVNSQWFDDKIKKNHHVHIGVAVAVDDGLLVPVVRFANEQTLPQIGAQVKEYAGKARNKKLTPQEMEGSTFTISNLGMFGITDFTSIINQPNSAILSVGAIVQKPIVKEGQIVVGNTMKLTMACDHRTVDGATGAQFLQTLRGYIENPVTMLV